MSLQKICLVVDNPLRDLDGLVLLAWHFAQHNFQVWLVPMYDQSFDIRAIRPDFVLLNYVRNNNLQHVYAYLQEGIKVGVLDTEGTGGKTPEEFAKLVGSSGGAQHLDLYCTWGSSQATALETAGVVPADRISITGCPRYDFCADPWRNALPKPQIQPGYVLVNTNFPIVNPRYSAGSHDEFKTMLSAGFDAEFATQYIADARQANQGMVKLIDTLCERFPAQQFVLRPHPFESRDPYEGLSKHANFQIRQEGTSLEWLNQCSLLLHLNCSTAVEASMLGKPAISPAWLDTPALRVPGPHQVSQHASSLLALKELFAAPAPAKTQQIESIYHSIDGQSSARTVHSVMQVLGQSASRSIGVPSPSLKSRLVWSIRRALGARLAMWVERKFADPAFVQKKSSKLFTAEQVQPLLNRIEAVAPPSSLDTIASPATKVTVVRPRLASGNTICIQSSSVVN
ncbi:surface carbohydrate biosynthesis protein [Limnobacter sp.]|uniref:surface carbohydrate biosynthesis protein n=1 Tax=Limnobacter sp. TaxID=2003368 RepID=UPI002FE2BC78